MRVANRSRSILRLGVLCAGLFALASAIEPHNPDFPPRPKQHRAGPVQSRRITMARDNALLRSSVHLPDIDNRPRATGNEHGPPVDSGNAEPSPLDREDSKTKNAQRRESQSVFSNAADQNYNRNAEIKRPTAAPAEAVVGSDNDEMTPPKRKHGDEIPSQSKIKSNTPSKDHNIKADGPVSATSSHASSQSATAKASHRHQQTASLSLQNSGIQKPTSTANAATSYTPTLDSLTTITTQLTALPHSSSSSSSTESILAEATIVPPTNTAATQSTPTHPLEPEIVLDSKIYAAAVQETLEVRDTTFVQAPALSELLESRPDVARIVDKAVLFSSHVHVESNNTPEDGVNRAPEQYPLQPCDGQTEAPIAQMGVTNSHGEPFLFPGQERTRTPRNCYIVHLEADADASLLQTIEDITVTIFHAHVKDRYDALGGMRGCTLCFPEGTLPLALLRSISGVRWVERDQYSVGVSVPGPIAHGLDVDEGAVGLAKGVASRMMAMRMATQDGEKAHTHEQEDAPWQLGRITNPRSQPSEPYRFSATGKGVTVYVIDSGVLTAHSDFGGRARLGFSTFASGFPQDCSGHGTQVASVAAGTNVGVAKRANIIGVQILDCTGQGENSSVIAAINWIISTHKKPSVINMSVGGPKSISVDAAVSKAVARGIPVVVAAGNSGVDACGLSPSGVPASIAVGASTSDNQRAAFSNYGSCVDVFAPGRQVVAAAIPSQAQHNGFALVSGTSLSAPLVAGIYALVLERMPEASPSELRKLLLAAAVGGVLVERTLRGSPNLLAQIVPIEPSRDEDTLNIMFLPRGSLPAPGTVSSSVSVLEIVLLSLAGVCGCVVSVLVILVLVRRRIRKRRELEIRTVPSVFR